MYGWTKYESAWAITPSKIVKLNFQKHMHIFISKVESESDER